MFWDVLIAVGIGLTQLAVTVYAVDISVREKRIKNAVVIAIVGLIGIGLIVAGTIRNAHSQEVAGKKQEELKRKIEAVQKKLDENQNANLTWTISLKHDHQELTPYLPFQVDTRFIVISSEAKNLRCHFNMVLMDGPPSSEQNKNASHRFRQEAVAEVDRRGQDSGPGVYCWTTVSLTLSEKSIPLILAGTKTIYVMGEAKWTNPSGSDGSTDVCSYIQRPTTRLLTGFTTVIHGCMLQ